MEQWTRMFLPMPGSQSGDHTRQDWRYKYPASTDRVRTAEAPLDTA